MPSKLAREYATFVRHKCPDFPTIPWIEGPPLNKGRLAIVLSGGLTVPATACSAAATAITGRSRGRP